MKRQPSVKKYKDELKVTKKRLNKLEEAMKDEREEFRLIIEKKDKEIAALKSELGRQRNDYDTLTTNNNDPYTLKQEVQDLNIMLDEIEQERDSTKAYATKLEAELKKTKDILQNNQLNLIEPLQKKIMDLEKIVDQKEADIKKRYKWKLRKYKREIEMERKVDF